MCKILTLRDDVIGHLVVAAEEVIPGALSLEVGVGAGRRLPKALMLMSGVTAKDGKTFRALPCQFLIFYQLAFYVDVSLLFEKRADSKTVKRKLQEIGISKPLTKR